ncbi:hypothetical protein CSP48_004016 [Salmonella enterica subsp. arizonae]|nr:hypothetical protein [Salmonella enterica subsp. arizonae]
MFCKVKFKGDDESRVDEIRVAAALGRLYMVRGCKTPNRVRYAYGVMYNELGRMMTESEMLCYNQNGRLRLLTWGSVE